MTSLIEILQVAQVLAAWATALICAVDLLIHSPVVLFLAKNAPGEHKNHYLTAVTIFLWTTFAIALEPTLESFVLGLVFNFALVAIHTADQVIFEARRDLPPIEAACHTWQLRTGAAVAGVYIGLCLTVFAQSPEMPRGWVLRELGPWAWSYLPLIPITFTGVISHGVEMLLAAGPKKNNHRWSWPLKKVMLSPIFWMPEELEPDNKQQAMRRAAGQ